MASWLTSVVRERWTCCAFCGELEIRVDLRRRLLSALHLLSLALLFPCPSTAKPLAQWNLEQFS